MYYEIQKNSRAMTNYASDGPFAGRSSCQSTYRLRAWRPGHGDESKLNPSTQSFVVVGPPRKRGVSVSIRDLICESVTVKKDLHSLCGT
jgi:hypothetical protein